MSALMQELEALGRREGHRAVGRRLGWVVIAALVCAGGVIALDVIFPMAAWARAMLAIAWAAATTGGVAGCALLAQRSTMRAETAARIAEERAGLDTNPFISAVQLERRSASGAIERELIERTVRRGDVLAREASDAGRLSESGVNAAAWLPWIAALLAAVSVGTVATTPLLQALPRFVDPWGDHPAVSTTLLKIAIEPGEKLVGDDVHVEVRIAGKEPESRPVLVVRRTGADSAAADAVLLAEQSAGVYGTVLRGVREDLIIFAEAGAARSRSVTIRPIARPRLVESWVRVRGPMGGEETVRGIGGREAGPVRIEAVQGSTVSIGVRATLPPTPEGIELSPEPTRLNVGSAAGSAWKEFVALSVGEVRAVARARSAEGSVSDEAALALLEVIEDRPPELEASCSVIERGDGGVAIELRALARDDVAIARLGVAWARLDARGAWVDHGVALAPDRAASQRERQQAWRFDAAELGASAGEKLVFGVHALESRAVELGAARWASAGLFAVTLGVSNKSPAEVLPDEGLIDSGTASPSAGDLTEGSPQQFSGLEAQRAGTATMTFEPAEPGAAAGPTPPAPASEVKDRSRGESARTGSADEREVSEPRGGDGGALGGETGRRSSASTPATEALEDNVQVGSAGSQRFETGRPTVGMWPLPGVRRAAPLSARERAIAQHYLFLLEAGSSGQGPVRRHERELGP